MTVLSPIYLLLGAYFCYIALRAARDVEGSNRAGRTGFFAVLAALFLLGDWLPSAASGALVLALALLAGFALPAQKTKPVSKSPAPAGGRLLWPVLAIPAGTVVLALALPHWRWDGVQPLVGQPAPLYALMLASLMALALAAWITREAPIRALARGGDLLESIGWAVLLPLLLAVLGALFTKIGVGDALAQALGSVLPLEVRWVAIIAYGLGMALLTMAMGNAFAAFPVIAGGIGMPYLVTLQGADPAPLAAIGMLSGYCGTLMTPMAANFNLVPVALLDLSDRNAVIKAQLPTAIPLLAANLILLGLLCFR